MKKLATSRTFRRVMALIMALVMTMGMITQAIALEDGILGGGETDVSTPSFDVPTPGPTVEETQPPPEQPPPQEPPPEQPPEEPKDPADPPGPSSPPADTASVTPVAAARRLVIRARIVRSCP